MGTVSPGTTMIGVKGYWEDVSLHCWSLRVRGGDVLLGPMPLLLEVSWETPLVTAADMLRQDFRVQTRIREAEREKRDPEIEIYPDYRHHDQLFAVRITKHKQ